MKLLSGKYFPYILLFAVVFISRYPFLDEGFGVEEDSWGIALAGLHTAASGIYEPSRFPGHPVHEYIYSAFPNHSPFFYNLFSALFSGVAAIFFVLILRKLKFRYAFLGGLVLAFTPVIYISGTYTIDFIWTLAFLLISFYFLLTEWFLVCGIFLGLAIGCRITMGAMLLPYLLILWNRDDKWKSLFKIVFPMTVVAVLVFLPLINEFGTKFFMYYDQFPYPPFTKVIYKMTIGVFGLVGLAMLVICKGAFFFKRNWRIGELFSQPLNNRIVQSSFLVIILFTISYFRLPQKSGYMITVIPFVIILGGYYLNSKWFKALCVGLIVSSFVFSVNLTDKLRGSEYSSLAMTFTISGQEIFVDPASGPLFSDYSKRKLKSKYVREVYQSAKKRGEQMVVIAGWWYNQIAVEFGAEQGQILYVPYINEKEIKNYSAQGYRIYYLPEQNIYNDQMFNIRVTDQLATPF